MAAGAGAQIVFEGLSEKHFSSIGMIGFYTQNKQYIAQIAPDIYFYNTLFRFSGNLGYIYYPDKYYGYGNNTMKVNEEDYTYRLFQFMPVLHKKILSNLYFGFKFHYAHTELNETEKGKELENGIITGSKGGTVSGFGVNTFWDSRDSNLYPTKGSYHQFETVSYVSFLGSNFDFYSYLLDLRHYRSIRSKHIIALRAVLGTNTGNPPFFILNSAGSLGNYLRGFTQSRYIEKHVITFQTEYRLPLFQRFGMVIFGGFGQVAHEIGDISFSELKPSAGFGFRFVLIPEQKVNLRIDIGKSEDDSSLDINIMEFF
ncbi:BamA/TamA family outer membrane protein [Candidatus Latescibacterota bacterium]